MCEQNALLSAMFKLIKVLSLMYVQCDAAFKNILGINQIKGFSRKSNQIKSSFETVLVIALRELKIEIGIGSLFYENYVIHIRYGFKCVTIDIHQLLMII